MDGIGNMLVIRDDAGQLFQPINPRNGGAGG